MIRPKSVQRGIYLYHLLDFMYRRGDFFALENGTTGIKNLPFTDFSKNHPLLSPPHEIMDRFTLETGGIIQKLDANGTQSQTLTQLRNTLLPKLISGEIRVPEAEKIVESAV